jgi:uncharacterized membrane protein
VARRRKRILGVPVGRAKPRVRATDIARVGIMGAGALAAVPAAQRGIRAMGKVSEVAGKAGDALGTVKDMKQAVSSHSSTVGKAVGMVGAVSHMGQNGQSGSDDDAGKPKLAHLIEEHTDIAVPRSVAYNQWTEFEMFPSIAKGVDSVDQLGDERAEWTSKVGPVNRKWRALITDQVPDERIAWRSEAGPEHRGVVSFHSLDDDLTRVLVQMHYVPHGPLETVGNKLRIQRRRVRRDLRLFKHFLELRGVETGAWRGSIGDHTDRSGGSGNSGGSGGGRPAPAQRATKSTRKSTTKRTTSRARETAK